MARVTDSGGNDKILCHALSPQDSDEVAVAHIVRDRSRLDDEACQDFFVLPKSELEGPGNSLPLSKQIKNWFDNHKIIVVPSPGAYGKEWQIEVLASDIHETPITPEIKGKNLHGKSLEFNSRSDHQPREYFLYFHFIVSMIRIWDEQPAGWEEIWSKYASKNPFPLPGKYLRTTLPVSLASSFDASMMYIIDRWLTNHGLVIQVVEVEGSKEGEQRKDEDDNER